MAHGRPRILYVVSSAGSADVLLRGQLRYLREAGFDVTVVASPDTRLEEIASREGVRVIEVPIERRIHLAHDLSALWRLWRVIRRVRPEIVNAGTPKAGLLGMIAAWLARVPTRIYTLRGLRLETSGRMQKLVLTACERTASWCAHRVVCVSRSLQQAYIERGLAPAAKTCVLGAGSSNGVDLARFGPADASASLAPAIRHQLGIPPGAFVVGFVGRLVRDKGLHDLVAIVRALQQQSARFHLLCVGSLDSNDSIDAAALQELRENSSVTITGFVADAHKYHQALDVLVLPSYREGFPNVVLEASAAGVPTVAYRATGTLDAVVDGTTGVLAPLGDSAALAAAIARYEREPQLRAEHGRAAQVRVRDDFAQLLVWRRWRSLYEDLLDSLMTKDTAPDAESFYRRRGKRLADFCMAATLIALLSPVLLAVATVVRLTMGRPVLFRQQRIGRGEKPFTFLKFRTMSYATDAAGALLPGAKRLTRVGRLLRMTSLDELPQLWNILRGDMSFVGPRPLLVDYLPYYTTRERTRHDVRPGLTGLAQISGRNDLDWDVRLELDVQYVARHSFRMDAKIAFVTIGKVLRASNVSVPELICPSLYDCRPRLDTSEPERRAA